MDMLQARGVRAQKSKKSDKNMYRSGGCFVILFNFFNQMI